MKSIHVGTFALAAALAIAVPSTAPAFDDESNDDGSMDETMRDDEDGRETSRDEREGRNTTEWSGKDADGAMFTLAPTNNYTPSPWTAKDGYGNRTLDKLRFGVTNTALGWTDLFIEPKNASRDGDPLYMGIGRGVRDLFANTLGGVVHVVTFPITAVDLPLPQGGTHVIG